MKFITNIKSYVPVTFMGHTLHMDKADFAMMAMFREEGIESILSCSLRDGKRYGYYTLQKPTKLVPGGELCPTEVVTHMPEDTLEELGLERDNLFNQWRDPKTGESLIGVKDAHIPF